MKLAEILLEKQNCLQLSEIDWYNLDGMVIKQHSDLDLVQKKVDGLWPGVKFSIVEIRNGHPPLITVWGPAKAMELFIAYYSGGDEDDMEHLIQSCEKVVK